MQPLRFNALCKVHVNKMNPVLITTSGLNDSADIKEAIWKGIGAPAELRDQDSFINVADAPLLFEGDDTYYLLLSGPDAYAYCESPLRDNAEDAFLVPLPEQCNQPEKWWQTALRWGKALLLLRFSPQRQNQMIQTQFGNGYTDCSQTEGQCFLLSGDGGPGKHFGEVIKKN